MCHDGVHKTDSMILEKMIRGRCISDVERLLLMQTVAIGFLSRSVIAHVLHINAFTSLWDKQGEGT